MMNNNFSFPNDFGDDDGEFSFGFIPINPNNLPKFELNINALNDLMKSMAQEEPLGSVFDGEYYIYLVNYIQKEGENDRLLLECSPNKKIKMFKHNLMEVYEYLNTTHYINFLLASALGCGVWNSENIELQLQIVTMINSTINSPNYSKLMIMAEISVAPNWLINYASKDMYFTKESEMCTIIPGIPIMIKTIKGKSYYTPALIYDLTFGFNRDSSVDFNNINLYIFYNHILRKYIDDALDTFYPTHKEDANLSNYGDKLLKIHFDADSEDKMSTIRMLCLPTMYYSQDNLKLYNYLYAVDSTHFIDSKVTDIDKTFYFINSVSSSDVTQVESFNIVNTGTVSHYYNDYNVVESNNVIFTLNRKIDPPKEISTTVFSDIESKISSHNIVDDYWIPISPAKFNINNNGKSFSVDVLGFINCNSKNIGVMNYEELFNTIEDELPKVFRIKREDISNGDVRFGCTYYTKNTIRVMIYKIENNLDYKLCKKTYKDIETDENIGKSNVTSNKPKCKKFLWQ